MTTIACDRTTLAGDTLVVYGGALKGSVDSKVHLITFLGEPALLGASGY